MKDRSDKPTIVIVTENERLERESMLLVRSIREFGGSLSDMPILSYQPRKGGKVSQETLSFFKDHDVEHIDTELNHRFPFFHLANKIYAASHAEQYAESSELIFLDSDILVLDEPREFLLDDEHDIALRPVDRKLIGSEGPGDINENYWQRVYELIDVKKDQYVTTSVDNKKIRGYWNSGHVIADRSLGFFNRWKENFEKVMDAQLVPWNGIYFIEQSTLGITVSQMDLRVKQLPKHYNYPLHHHGNFTDPQNGIDNIDEATTLHYHKVFEDAWLKWPVKGFFNKGHRSKWIAREMKRAGFFRISPSQGLAHFLRGLARRIES